MQWFGIDTSRYQGDFNFKQAMTEGVQFAILKAGGADDGYYRDSQFENSYSKCKALGLPIGAYYYGNATSVDAARVEADKFLALLNGKQLEMPVFYDVEGKMLKLDMTLLTDICLAFLERVEAAGWFTGIYGNPNSYNNHLDDKRLTHFCHWMACYSKTMPSLKSGMSVGIWQFGGGKTNYIRSNIVAGKECDQDYCYVDYPSAIKDLGLNGYGKEYDIAKPVLSYGDMNNHIVLLQENLKALGYDVVADGLFDERTRDAVKKWQSSVGLSVTGEYGIEDYNKMVKSL